MRVLTKVFTRTYHCKYVVLVSAKSPARAILLKSPGRKPWVNRRNTFIEPQRGGTNSAYLVCVVAVRGFAS